MMISTTPSVAEVDAAMNLLSILELAKDATKLKAALAKIKEAQDAAQAERQSADAAVEAAQKQAVQLEKQAALLEQERAKLAVESARVFKASDDITLAQQAMRDERNAFDAWMAVQREALAADKAKAESDAVANARRAEDLKMLKDAAARREKAAEDAQRMAEDKCAEYEAKLATLKAMVS